MAVVCHDMLSLKHHASAWRWLMRSVIAGTVSAVSRRVQTIETICDYLW